MKQIQKKLPPVLQEIYNKQVQGSIKQIKGARLDMSKARGARPPDIVRPNGSRIPQGIGKPAGAGKPGRS